jgi:acetoin utilization deacetylase AcuC-like enzyme
MTFTEPELRQLIDSIIEFTSHHEPDEYNEWFEKKLAKLKELKTPNSILQTSGFDNRNTGLRIW